MSLPRLKLALAALLLGCGVFSLPVISGQLKPDDQGKVTEAEPSLDEVREREKAKSSDSALVSALASSFAKPWESVVRVRVLSSGSVGVGSGTIIHSTANEAIILTCAHIFKIDGESHQPFERLPRRIEVDLFDGKLQGEQLAQVHYVESHPGEVIDFDFNRDVGLIRIRPGRQLPSSRVVPAHWEPQVGMKMLTLGCSEGQDATAWSTLIVNARVKALVGQPDYEAIVCQVAPKQGRTGGGLFTSDGYLAGVCNFAEPKEDHGLYATPRSIYRLLDRNNLSFLYAGSKATRSEFDELVGQAESQLVERNREEAGETLGRLNRLIDARREELQTELRSLDANYARRSDELKRRLSEVPPEPSSETVPEKDIAVPGVDLAPDPPALKDAEARLDQILEEWHRRSTNYASLDVRFTLRESTPKWGDEISGTGRLVLAEGGRALVTLDRGKGPSKNRDRIIWSDDAVHQFVSASKTHTIWPIGAGDRGRVPTLLALPFGWKLDAEKLRSRFRVELLADNPAATCLLRLTPQSPVGRGTLCKAFLELDRASYLPKRYIVISPDGHSTRDFRVLQIERDQTQPEELWRIPDDDGWKVTRPGAIEQWLFRLIKPDLVP